MPAGIREGLSMKKIIAEPLKREKLSEIVESHIRDRILDGDFAIGERLPTEKELSAQFGVSIVTAREALKGLGAVGLIEKRKGKGGGIFVSHSKLDSVKIPLYSFLQANTCSYTHLTELRMVVEPGVVRIAASRITEGAIKDLERNIDFCASKIRSVGGSLTEETFFEIEQKNVEFHRLIAEATDNPVMSLTVDYVMDFLFKFKLRMLIPDIQFSARTVQDHRKILAHLKKADPEGAERSMVLHLEKLELYVDRKSENVTF